MLAETLPGRWMMGGVEVVGHCRSASRARVRATPEIAEGKLALVLFLAGARAARLVNVQILR
jgi:hypothetical protein